MKGLPQGLEKYKQTPVFSTHKSPHLELSEANPYAGEHKSGLSKLFIDFSEKPLHS